MQEEAVGFIGLGVMGGPMSRNLVEAGYEVIGFDTAPERREEAAAAGVTIASSGEEAARAATRTVVSIVRDAAQTRDVIHGAHGVLAAGRTRLDLLVMSTLDPTTMWQLADELASHGITAIEAPVSGGRAGAEQGTLTIITSGDGAVVERLRPLMEAMGKNVFYVGERPGMGQAAKLANQLMLAVNMLGVHEGLQIAAAQGVDERLLMDLLSVSTGGSWVTEHWDRVRGFWRDYVPGNEIDIICKDLRSTLQEADHRRLSLPVTAVAFQRIRHSWGSGE
jgi:3-hydroxyisobutyrate dehydrogenase